MIESPLWGPLLDGGGRRRHIGSMEHLPALSDEELATRGDRAAVEILYHRHARALLTFLTARAPGLDPEDLLHETWLKVVASLGGAFRGGHFRGWLFHLARNLLIDRGRRVRPAALETEPPSSGADPIEELIDAERRRMLATCLDRLEGGNPLAAKLARGLLTGAGYDELCPPLGLTRERAYKLWHKTLRDLQTCVGGEDA
jgi:RNA polymerase sigma factor (sigma-70 family)